MMVRVLLLLGCLVCLAAGAAQDKYAEGRFAHINVEEILSNQRILVSFIKCFLDQGPCTADARDMRKLLPEVIESSCGKCTDKQKQLMARAVQYVRDHRSSEWEQLVNKYDPDHKKVNEVDMFIKEALGQ